MPSGRARGHLQSYNAWFCTWSTSWSDLSQRSEHE